MQHHGISGERKQGVKSGRKRRTAIVENERMGMLGVGASSMVSRAPERECELWPAVVNRGSQPTADISK